MCNTDSKTKQIETHTLLNEQMQMQSHIDIFKKDPSEIQHKPEERDKTHLGV